MDININIENYGEAYKCLNQAYELIKNDLGNFDKLNKIALHLIDKNSVAIQNTNMLDKFYDDCQLLKSRMNDTIELLSQVDSEAALYFQNFFSNLDEEFIDYESFSSNVTDYGSRAHLEYVRQFAKNSAYQNIGPSGIESWCSLGVSQLVKNMEELYKYTNLEDSIREDGVRVLSGVDPDGQCFEDLVIVAADVYHEKVNPGGTFQRGQIVETSLGTGIVVDLCERAMNERKAGGPVLFDIYAAFYEKPYVSMIYGDD